LKNGSNCSKTGYGANKANYLTKQWLLAYLNYEEIKEN
jgi:hypothetical protein